MTSSYRPIDWNDFESLTVSTVAVGLTNATTKTQAFITIENSAVRYRLDGTDPTAAIGHALEVGGILELEGGGELSKIKFIRRDAVDAVLRITYGGSR